MIILETIIIIVLFILILVLIMLLKKLWFNIVYQKKEIIELNRALNVCEHWISLQQSGYEMKEYLLKNDYKKIGIAGINMICYLLLDELSNSDICVKYVFGKKRNFAYSGYIVKNYDEIENEQLDLVIFADYKNYQSEKEKYIQRYQCETIRVDDLIFNIGNGGIYNEPVPLWRKEYGINE